MLTQFVLERLRCILATIEAIETSGKRKLRHIYPFGLLFLTEDGVSPSGNTRGVVGPNAPEMVKSKWRK